MFRTKRLKYFPITFLIWLLVQAERWRTITISEGSFTNGHHLLQVGRHNGLAIYHDTSSGDMIIDTLAPIIHAFVKTWCYKHIPPTIWLTIITASQAEKQDLLSGFCL